MLDYPAFGRSIAYGLKFGFCGCIAFNGKVLSVWSRVRRALQDDSIKCHAHLFSEVHEIKCHLDQDPESQSPTDLAQSILQGATTCENSSLESLMADDYVSRNICRCLVE